MVDTTPFDFSEIVINIITQKPEVNPTSEELKEYCKPNIGGGIIYKTDDEDKLTKLTVADRFMEYFDTIAFTKQSQLLNYSGIVNQINQAKKDRKTIIDITKQERDGLIDIFSIPPKEPKHNSSYMFIVNCLQKKEENPKKSK